MCALNSKTITYRELVKTLDLALLKPRMTETDIIAGCERARSYHLASVSVKPCYLKLAVGELAGSDVVVGTVVGFPLGNNTPAIKVAEAREAVANGAVELDMVMNIGELRSGHTQYVQDEIQSVVEAAEGKAIVKVILENVYLTGEQIVQACKLAEAAGADFVKTSSGFSPRGATLGDVRLMRASVGPGVQVKAAGGVKSLDALLAVIDAGATRVGASAAIRMLDEFKRRFPNR
jgi:deoxyribose-phosphate aldolase